MIIKNFKKLNDSTETLDYIREALLLNKLEHANIIEFYGIVVDDGGVLIKYLLFEFMNMGDLLGFLNKEKVNMNFILKLKIL